MEELDASALDTAIRGFERELQQFYDHLEVCEDPLATNPVKFLVFLSWHQCHSDLYRMFLNGYGEAATPPSAAMVASDDGIWMQKRCLTHAETIIQSIENYSKESQSHRPLEFDPAVCAYHSSMLVLFGARAKRDLTKLTLAEAIEKARFCLVFIKKTYATLESAKPMVSFLSPGKCSKSTVLTEPANTFRKVDRTVFSIFTVTTFTWSQWLTASRRCTPVISGCVTASGYSTKTINT